MERVSWDEVRRRYKVALQTKSDEEADERALKIFEAAFNDGGYYAVSDTEIRSRKFKNAVYGGRVPEIIQRAMQKAMERT